MLQNEMRRLFVNDLSNFTKQITIKHKIFIIMKMVINFHVQETQ